MKFVVRPPLAMIFAALIATSLAGCSKAPKAADPTPSFGDWIEVVDKADDPGRSVRMAVPKQKPKQIRQLTIGADNTFTLVVCDPSGKPISGKNTITGKWALDGNSIVFTATSEEVADEFKNWKPVSTSGSQSISTEDGGSVERLYVADADDNVVIYQRK